MEIFDHAYGITVANASLKDAPQHVMFGSVRKAFPSQKFVQEKNAWADAMRNDDELYWEKDLCLIDLCYHEFSPQWDMFSCLADVQNFTFSILKKVVSTAPLLELYTFLLHQLYWGRVYIFSLFASITNLHAV